MQGDLVLIREPAQARCLPVVPKVFGATGPGGPNDSGLSRKHIHESINASLSLWLTLRV